MPAGPSGPLIKMRRNWMRKVMIALGALVLSAAVAVPAMGQTAVGGGDGSDDMVTGKMFVRHDGGSDAAIVECNDGSSSPAADDDLADGDSDSNDGGSRRQANEPYSVVDPTDPDTIVAGWNDYCLADLDAGWEGFAFSRDSGETWTNSLVPGYPQDTSAEGQASPLFGDHRFAGDPIGAFDGDGNLFVGGISFNRAGAVNGDVFVATYGAQEGPGGYPVDYLRTRIVGKGTPSRNFQGVFQDKPMLEVDRTGGTNDGNVYVCWSRFTGFGQNRILFSRSTDMGNTFSKPISLTTPGQVGSVQGCDIAVEADGDITALHRADLSGRGQRDRFRERVAHVGGAAEQDAVLAEAGEARPAHVDVAVVGPPGAVDLEHGLVLEDSLDVAGRRALADDPGAQVVDRVAARPFLGTVGGHEHVAVDRSGTVEGDAPDEKVAVAVESAYRVSCETVVSEQGRRLSLRRGVLRVARHQRGGPRLTRVTREGEALPACIEIGETVVVPTGHNCVRVGRVHHRVGLVGLPAAAAVVGVRVAVGEIVVGRGTARAVVALDDGRVAATVVAHERLPRHHVVGAIASSNNRLPQGRDGHRRAQDERTHCDQDLPHPIPPHLITRA